MKILTDLFDYTYCYRFLQPATADKSKAIHSIFLINKYFIIFRLFRLLWFNKNRNRFATKNYRNKLL